MPPRNVSVPATLFNLVAIGINWGAAWPPMKFHGTVIWSGWSAIEKTPGEVEFSFIDAQVSAAQEHGQKVILVLGDVPSWAFCDPHPPIKHAPSEPACRLSDWNKYVDAVLDHYRNAPIEAIELWNEPNSATFYKGSIASLLKMNKSAYLRIKKARPDTLVLSPGFVASDDSWNYLDEYAAGGGLNYADVLSEHFYVSPRAPEAMLPKIRRARAVLTKYRRNIPIWNTETGWLIPDHDRIITDDPQQRWAGRFLTDEEATAYVGRSFILTWAAGVDRLYWFNWGSTTMALNEYDLKTPKRSAIAFQEIAEWMTGWTLRSCGSSSGIWTCELMKEGNRSLIAWSELGKNAFTIPSTMHVAQELASATTPLSSSSYQLGIIPTRFTSR